MQQLKDWFNSLKPRERAIVAGGAAIVVLVALYTFALAPFYKTLHERSERVAHKESDLAYMRSVAGELQVLGANQPIGSAPSGESLVRNLGLGLRVAERFGAAMRVGYMPDPFGHVAQMPQIVRGFGLEGAILWRGFGGRRAEYLWRAPDDSEVLLLHLPPKSESALRLLPADHIDSAESLSKFLPQPLSRQSYQLL